VTIKYAIYGLCFGWVLIPRWRGRNRRIPASVLAYALAIVIAVGIICFFEYNRQTLLFVVGMASHLSIFTVAKWMRFLSTGLGRKIRR
jgi:hypothetical protein